MSTPPTVLPSVLIPDLGSEVSNSYVDMAYADAYWSADYRAGLSAQWAALDVPTKTKLLIAACREIERYRFTVPQAAAMYALQYNRLTRTVIDMNLTLQPVKLYYYQRLQFPRNIDLYMMGLPVDVTQPPEGYAPGTWYIPEPVKEAQCEQAMYMLTYDNSDIIAQMNGIKSQTTTLGKQNVEIQKTYTGRAGTMLSPDALVRLTPYVVNNGGMLRA